MIHKQKYSKNQKNLTILFLVKSIVVSLLRYKKIIGDDMKKMAEDFSKVGDVKIKKMKF